MTIDRQRQHKRFSKNKKIKQRFKWQTGQDVRGLDMKEEGGYTAVRFLLITSRASAEEMPLCTKERGGLQYSTVSAL